MSEGEVLTEGVDVALEGGAAEGGDAAQCAGALAGEAFFDGYVSGSGEAVELHTEVAGGRLGLFTEIYEVGFLDIHKYRHDGEAQLGVQQWVEFLHLRRDL